MSQELNGTDRHSSGAQSAHKNTDPAVLKQSVARFVTGKYGDSPRTASRVMQSIYGKDYAWINSQGLGRRLKLVTALLSTMQKTPAGQNLAVEVLRRIQTRMDQVPDEILDDFVVRDDTLAFWSEGTAKKVDRVDRDLSKIVDHSKSRSGERRRGRTRLTPEKDYTDLNFEEIASDFGIPAQDLKEIIGLFKSCLDTQGNFLKSVFEKNVSQFADYEKKVFEILWEFLKETSRRNNRLSLLYALQVLVKETKRPIQAIKLLLTHFIQNPARVSYTDRNAIMLINQYLRTYTRKSDMDIEMTPDEILLIRGGLDSSAANYAVWKLESQKSFFLEKMVTMHQKLIEAMAPDSAEGQHLPARFLLALEREVCIFFALVGGGAGSEVIRRALSVYGNPDSRIYHLKESANDLEPLLLNLSAIVRGFARHAEQADFALLAEVRSREMKFKALHEDPHYHELVGRVMSLIDERFKF